MVEACTDSSKELNGDVVALCEWLTFLTSKDLMGRAEVPLVADGNFSWNTIASGVMARVPVQYDDERVWGEEQIFEIPSYEASRFEVLRFVNCGLTGTLSESISRLQGLQVVHLALNSLSGVIPDNWDRLVNLRFLDLSNNKFRGEIPESLTRCSSLTELWLNGNQISGE